MLLNGILPLVLLALFLFMYRKERKAKQLQNKLIESLGAGDYINWFRVKVARLPHFRRRLKLQASEGRALLVNANDYIRVMAERGNGETIDRSFDKSDLNLKWIGNPGLGSSNMHWISVGSDDIMLMLTSDTGLNSVPSRESTADMCRMLAPGFQLPASAKNDFALEKNSASLSLIVIFFALAAYALLDGIVLNQHELINYGQIRWMPRAYASKLK